jgi:hypothetical protein
MNDSNTSAAKLRDHRWDQDERASNLGRALLAHIPRFADLKVRTVLYVEPTAQPHNELTSLLSHPNHQPPDLVQHAMTVFCAGPLTRDRALARTPDIHPALSGQNVPNLDIPR